MQISCHIDWLAITSKTGKDGVFPFLLDEPYEDVNPRNGYSLARRFVQGVVEMSNPDHNRMGVHVVYSAQALRVMELEHKFTAMKILDFHMRKGHHIARLDIAIDLHDSGLDIRKLFKQCEDSKCQTRSNKYKGIFGDENDGDTLYVGSMKKRSKLLRIYDKAKERKISGDWKRIELELRGKLASQAAKVLLESDDIGKVSRSMIRAFAHFPEDEIWEQFMNVPEIPITVSNRRSSNTERWLLKQCAPALARAVLANPDFMSAFTDAVDIKIKRMKSGAMHD